MPLFRYEIVDKSGKTLVGDLPPAGTPARRWNIAVTSLFFWFDLAFRFSETIEKGVPWGYGYAGVRVQG